MKKKPNIVIVDYGVGNLHSLIKATGLFDAEVKITEESSEILAADAVILPGVGSFEAGMAGLECRNLVATIQEVARANKPILGICLGAQLLLTTGYEFGIFKGLDIIPGKVVFFPKITPKEKIPHIGWNGLRQPSEEAWKGTVLDSIKPASSVYFVHSYILEPVDPKHILALTTYGDCQFCSAVKYGNIYGLQFHPEKSGLVGLEIIKNFIKFVLDGLYE